MRKYKKNRKYNKPKKYKKNMPIVLRWMELGYCTRQELLKVTNLNRGELAYAISKLVEANKIESIPNLFEMKTVTYRLKEVVE